MKVSVGMSLFFAASAAVINSPAHSQIVKESVVFIRVQDRATPPTIKSEGTGILVNQTGFIITAKHIFEGYSSDKDDIKVSLLSRSRMGVPASKFDCGNTAVDVCVIKIDAQDVQAERINSFPALSCRPLGLSEQITAVGYPVGGGGLLTIEGRISGDLTPEFLMPAQLGVVSGMSGGPIHDSRGRVVGVVKGAATGMEQYQFFTPLQFAIPILSATAASCSSEPLVCPDLVNSVDEAYLPQNGSAPSRKPFGFELTASSGCRIVDVEFENVLQSHGEGLKKELVSNGDRATIAFDLISGPYYQPYTASLKMTVRAKQKPK